MGLGKTLTAISLLCYLMEEKQNQGPFCTRLLRLSLESSG
jgi:SNF2 family DNA or RNA helicase